MAMIDFDIDDYLEDASTQALLDELSNRNVDELLLDNPLVVLDEMQRAFDRNDAYEFEYLRKKLEAALEHRHA